jgi:thermostable 8-oxoguanine DNA glycosylase
MLNSARSNPISNWLSHYDRVKPIKGVALSTYTKFLHFLSVEVENHAAVILDQRIIDVVRKKVFDELAPLTGLSYDNAPRNYLRYLECLENVAQQLSVSKENIEFFLFEFGLHLKPT